MIVIAYNSIIDKRKTPHKIKESKIMRNWRVWVLVDKDGKEIAKGRKKDVVNASYHRYVYKHIFTDTLYRTNELL